MFVMIQIQQVLGDTREVTGGIVRSLVVQILRLLFDVTPLRLLLPYFAVMECNREMYLMVLGATATFLLMFAAGIAVGEVMYAIG